MRTAQRVAERRRMASAGLLLAAMAIGAGACSGPPSHDPSPKKWEDNGSQPRAAAQLPDDSSDSDSSDDSDNSDDSGDSGGGAGSVAVCEELDVATVQQAFDTSEEPSTTSGEQAGGLQGLDILGGCTYEWGEGGPAGSLTVTAAVADSSDDAATYLEGQASSVGLSGESIDGFGDASLLDTSGSVQSDAAVAVGATDTDGAKSVIVLVGPVQADASAYADVGSTVMSTIGQG